MAYGCFPLLYVGNNIYVNRRETSQKFQCEENLPADTLIICVVCPHYLIPTRRLIDEAPM